MQSKDEKIASLEDNVAKANDKIEALRHESQFALQEKSNLEGQLKQMQIMLSSGKDAGGKLTNDDSFGGAKCET
jgi:chromosome segregation ATPase